MALARARRVGLESFARLPLIRTPRDTAAPSAPKRSAKARAGLMGGHAGGGPRVQSMAVRMRSANPGPQLNA